jgi:hypothetical protein
MVTWGGREGGREREKGGKENWERNQRAQSSSSPLHLFTIRHNETFMNTTVDDTRDATNRRSVRNALRPYVYLPMIYLFPVAMSSPLDVEDSIRTGYCTAAVRNERGGREGGRRLALDVRTDSLEEVDWTGLQLLVLDEDSSQLGMYVLRTSTV